MVRKLVAAVVAILGVLSIVAVPTPAVAQSDEQSEDQTTESSEAGETATDAEAVSTAIDDETETEPAAATVSVIAKRGDRGGAVRTLQTRLAEAGFSPGVVDGIFGGLTQRALVSFQNTAGLSPSGVYDSTTAERLSSYSPPPTTGDSADAGGSPAGIMSTREAQQRLTDAGFDAGPVDGLYGRRTRSGLEAFQRHVALPVSGRIDAATSEALRNFQVGSGAPDPTSTDDDDDPGDGAAVNSLRDAQRALADGPFDPGPIDGEYGTKTRNAIWSLEKLAGIAVNGQWGSDDEAALRRVLNGSVGGPATSHTRRWVEVDLSEQLMKVYDPGKTVPVLVSHISSGNGIPWRQGRYSGRSITPVGSFTIFRRISGWRVSSLGIGSLYNPLYFTTSGIALHGSRSVPSYPASHGCVRVPMHIAEYLPGMLPNGTPVVVLR